MNADVQIQLLDPTPASAEVAEIVELQRLVDAEHEPDIPPVSHEQVDGYLRSPLPDHTSLTWLARADGALVGRMTALIDRRPTNVGFAEMEEPMVHPGCRRRGIATRMVESAVGVLSQAGARSLLLWPGDDPGRRFCEGLGLTHRQDERQSRLRVAEVDEAQQDEWIAAPRARAAGYRVVSWEGPVPEDHLDQWRQAHDAMADAPLDGIEWAHEPVSVEWVRGTERVSRERGVQRWASLALDADGSAAGMTLILLHPSRAQLAEQEDTAVVPAHRGFALGRWLKAANLRRLRLAHPELEIVDTYNAETNGPMLDINVAMGFRPHHTYSAFQAPIEQVADRVASHLSVGE